MSTAPDGGDYFQTMIEKRSMLSFKAGQIFNSLIEKYQFRFDHLEIISFRDE